MASLADLLTRTIPPHSLEAERAVLASLLLDAEALQRFRDQLVVTDFFKEGHRQIFKAVLRVAAAGQGVDLVTATEALRVAGELDTVGGPAALAQLVEEAGTLTNLGSYITIIRGKAMLRELISQGTEIVGKAYENGISPGALAAAAAEKLAELARSAGPVAGTFPALSLAELLGSVIPEPTFHVHGWIPAGALTFIVGDSEACKSWFAGLLGISVAVGCPLFGRFHVLQAPTLVISEENGLLEDRRRAELLARGLQLEPAGVPFFLLSDAHFSFDDPIKYMGLHGFIDAHGIKLVIIDSFVRVHRRKENDAGEMSALYMDRMRPLLEAGVALVLLHHRRKAQPGPGPVGTSDSDEIRGSGDIRAATHSVLFLRTVSDTQVLVKHNKSRGFRRQEPFVFRIQDLDAGGVALTWEGKPEDVLDKSGGCREAILLYAIDKGAFARRDLEIALKGQFSRKTFDPVLKALAATGTPLRLEHPGRYHSSWYVYVPQASDASLAPEPDDAELPF